MKGKKISRKITLITLINIRQVIYTVSQKSESISNYLLMALDFATLMYVLNIRTLNIS